MKKLLLTLAVLPLAAYAGGASAQTSANAGGTVAIQNRIANLEERFNAGSSAGVFTNVERNAISRKLAELRSLERTYSYNGLTQVERRTLQQRIRTVRDQLRMAGGPNWAQNYGWSDADLDASGRAYGQSGSYDAYGRPIQSSGATYDRYGRPVTDNNSAYDRSGRAGANNGVVYDQYGRPIANSGVETDRYGRPVADNRVVYDRSGRAVANNDVVYDQFGRPIANGVETDRYGRPIANNRVVYDRNGRPVEDDGYYDQGGSSAPVSRSNRGGDVLGSVLGGGGGVGGVLGSVIGGGGGTGGVLGSVLGGGGGMGGILGSILSRGGLRTGDVITSTIGSVLGSAVGQGSQFRDTSNVYYRSDGERVYEIDARTNVVNRVYPVQR